MRDIEADLVPRVQAGDHDAFAVLVERVYERLYGTARLILLDGDLARDAAQDTLVAAWRDIRALQDPRGLDAWLDRRLIRACDRVTGNATRGTVSDLGGGVPAADGDESRRAFDALTRNERAILALVYFADLSAADVAVVLDILPAESETRCRDALGALRTALGIDDTPSARVDLEWRLRAWLAREAAPPDPTEASADVIVATRTVRQRRGRFVPGRRIGVGVGVAAALALTVAIIGGVLLSRGVRPPERAEHRSPTGALSPTGDISALAGNLDQPVIAVLSDGRVLVIGLGAVLIGGIVYDPTTGTYGDPIRDEVLRRGSTATTLGNNLVLLTGGRFDESETPSTTAVLFDPVSSTFATTNPLSTARVGHTATLLDDGRVLIAGGRHTPGANSRQIGQVVIDASAEIYDPATGLFTPTSPMIHARAGHTSTKLRDGRVLIAGGYLATQSGDVADRVADAEVFDPATGTFRTAGTMITPRGDHSATLLGDGRVLIAGGAASVGAEGEVHDALPAAEIFDPKTATFSPVRSLVTERADHSATLLSDGRVLVAGGRNEFGEPRTTEIFDPGSGTFTAGPIAAAPHRAAVAPLIAGGRVLLTGSGPGASEVFDPTADGVAATAPSATPRSGAFRPIGTSVARVQPLLVELADGRVLILGGWGSNGKEIVATETFDPATGQTSPTGTLLHHLSGPTATRLPNGQVFIFGNAFNDTGAAEIFEPATGTFGGASEVTDGLLSARHPLPVPGLPDGRILVSDGLDMIQVFDATTRALGSPIRVCESPQSVIPMDESRVLVGCGENSAVISDLAAGTSEPAGFAFDRAIRLDARRIALILGSWHFGDSGNGSPILDRVTGIFDPLERSIQPVPDGAIGETVVVVGDRLLAFGGTASDGSASNAAVSVDTRSWTSTELGQMLGARSGASAIVLRDGRVLVVGGTHQSPDRTDPLPPGAEIFDPSVVP